MKQKKEIKIENETEFQEIIYELIQNPTVQEMRNYRQHFQTSCYEHCYQAAYYCYKIAKKFHWDYRSATRAAMLHDLFLYDWREKTDRHGLHAYTHGKTACQNASALFPLSDKEKDIITKHMWPVTLALPKSKEGFLLTFVDKYCAIEESFEQLHMPATLKKFSHCISVFFTVILFKKIL